MSMKSQIVLYGSGIYKNARMRLSSRKALLEPTPSTSPLRQPHPHVMNAMKHSSDVVMNLLDYDWRAGSNCPMPAPSAPLAQREKLLFSACDPQTPGVSRRPQRRDSGPTPTGPPGRTYRANSPQYTPEPSLRKSTLAPGLVPDFFRSHLGPAAGIKSELTVEEGLGLVSPRQPPGPPPPIKYTPTNSLFAPSLFSMGAPLKPHITTEASIATHTPQPTPRSFDPAANMLCMLESRLQNIKTAVKALPRTGFSNSKACSSMAPATPPIAPQTSRTKPTPNDNEMNDFFVALVSCDDQSKGSERQMPTQMMPTPLQGAAPMIPVTTPMMPVVAPTMQTSGGTPMMSSPTSALGKRTAGRCV